MRSKRQSKQRRAKHSQIDRDGQADTLDGTIMTTFIFFALFFLAGVAVGALAYRNNAAKASKLEAKGIDILKALKRK